MSYEAVTVTWHHMTWHDCHSSWQTALLVMIDDRRLWEQRSVLKGQDEITSTYHLDSSNQDADLFHSIHKYSSDRDHSFILTNSIIIIFIFGGIIITAVIQLSKSYTTIVTVKFSQIIIIIIVLIVFASRIIEIVEKILESMQNIKSKKFDDVLPIIINGYVVSIKISVSVFILVNTILFSIIPIIISAATISAESAVSVAAAAQKTITSIASGKKIEFLRSRNWNCWSRIYQSSDINVVDKSQVASTASAAESPIVTFLLWRDDVVCECNKNIPSVRIRQWI